jgi:hypothetical protein
MQRDADFNVSGRERRRRDCRPGAARKKWEADEASHFQSDKTVARIARLLALAVTSYRITFTESVAMN